jgi:hypothetical protein
MSFMILLTVCHIDLRLECPTARRKRTIRASAAMVRCYPPRVCISRCGSLRSSSMLTKTLRER